MGYSYKNPQWESSQDNANKYNAMVPHANKLLTKQNKLKNNINFLRLSRYALIVERNARLEYVSRLLGEVEKLHIDVQERLVLAQERLDLIPEGESPIEQGKNLITTRFEERTIVAYKEKLYNLKIEIENHMPDMEKEDIWQTRRSEFKDFLIGDAFISPALSLESKTEPYAPRYRPNIKSKMVRNTPDYPPTRFEKLRADIKEKLENHRKRIPIDQRLF